MTDALTQRAEHIERVRTDLAAAQGEAMANTAAARRSVADIARAALAVAAKPPAGRLTTATERRVEQTKALIAEFSTREMLADDICRFLGYTPSGGRKYIKNLRDAGVIELARYIDSTASYLGKAVYCLTADQGVVDSFIALLAEPRDTKPAPASGKPRRQAISGRHFHIMADDTHFQIRAHRGPVARDPLVAALFGPAAAEVRA